MVDASCLNASPGGFMIRAGQEFALDEEVEIALEMSDGSRVHCNGKVVRQDPRLTEGWQGKGYGIQIVGIEPTAAEQLSQWLNSSNTGTGPVTRADVLKAMERSSAKRQNAAAAPQVAVAAAAARSRRPPISGGPPPAQPTTRRPGKRMDPLELQRVLLRLKKKRPPR